MKRMIVLVFILMLLWTPLSFADSVTRITDITIETNEYYGSDGEWSSNTMTYDDLEIVLYAEQDDGFSGIHIEAYRGDEKLAGATVNVLNNRILFAFDEATSVLYIDKPVVEMGSTMPVSGRLDMNAIGQVLLNGVVPEEYYNRITWPAIRKALRMLAAAFPEDVDLEDPIHGGTFSPSRELSELAKYDTGIYLEYAYDTTSMLTNLELSGHNDGEGDYYESLLFSINLSLNPNLFFSLDITDYAYFSFSIDDDGCYGSASGNYEYAPSYYLTTRKHMEERPCQVPRLDEKGAGDLMVLMEKDPDGMRHYFATHSQRLVKYFEERDDY